MRWRAIPVLVLGGLCLAAIVAWGWRAAVVVACFALFAGVATVGAVTLESRVAGSG
ncbi:MAG TPA: hypothetical protein VNH40_14265 [Gaiellaceae bacterium]|nr:hypothetical protein [Gaiellaceae bacterium]